MVGKRRLLPLENRVRTTVSKFGMLSRGERVLIAVSGGADSMALLHCLLRLAPAWDLTLSAAHLNHRLRGSASDEDEAFVRTVCGELGIAFVSEVVEVGKTARSRKQNLEEAAREVRYEFLRRAARDSGAQKIALGHTLDDQAETVLMRLLRGSGADGLSAIRPVVDGRLIRPLLECQRDKILQYLEIRGIPFREDSSNQDLSFRRNRVRRELLPYLRQHFNPNLTATLSKEAELSREVAEYLDSQAAAAWASIRVHSPDGPAFPAQHILEMHPALRRAVVRVALRNCRGHLRGITGRHVDQILDLCRPLRSGRCIKLPGGWIAARQFGNLIIAREQKLPGVPREFDYSLPVPGRRLVPEAGLEFSAAEVDEKGATAENPNGSATFWAVLDAGCLPSQLTIRSRRPGDRYGGTGHRKVKKLLIDARVPAKARESLPMVADGSCVIWIPGFKPAKPYIPQTATHRRIVVKAIKVQ